MTTVREVATEYDMMGNATLLFYAYLGHPFTVLSLQTLFGLLEMGVLIFISRRLQVVVHGVRRTGCGCGHYVNTREKKRRQADGITKKVFLYCHIWLHEDRELKIGHERKKTR